MSQMKRKDTHINGHQQIFLMLCHNQVFQQHSEATIIIAIAYVI